jgi:hypothetical protein
MFQNVSDYITHVFSADELLICQIIQSFNYTCGTGSPQKELKNLLSKKLIPTERWDELLNYGLGWVKEQTDLLLEEKKPARISVGKFRTNLLSFVRKLHFIERFLLLLPKIRQRHK